MFKRYRDLLRFGLVGGVAFAVTLAVTYLLKLTVRAQKPVTALAIATVTATMVSYVLSRTWSFRTRSGHPAKLEAALFVLVNAGATLLNLVPALISRYVLHLHEPDVSRAVQEIADFVSGMVLGTALGTAFRWWGYQRWVFPARAALGPL
jgi:putative flippase GtrA